MDTNRLKRFAVEARTILMQGVKNRLQAMGFDLQTGKAIEMPQAIEGGAVFMGDTVSTDFYRRWMSLYNNICARGIRQVAEEAAYTWFNRFVAIRIMQKQGFISPVLAYESDEVRIPVIVSEARQGRMPQMAADVREKLMEILDNDGKTNEQFALLIVAYCHENPIINKCFGNIADYTELLLPQNILAEGGFVSILNSTGFITDDDFRSAELIGWLYQFYISDRKDEAFAKKGKYDADEIAPATQIFTPNWIVKYMVENTVGRIYIDNNPYCEVKGNLKYLVDTPQSDNTLQVDDLAELTVADLACGSGHILNECFDLLFQIYVEEGYSRSQAITNILRKNILGIDLDTRAKQLATFALLMKACQKDTSFLDGRIMPRVYDMPHPIAEAISAEGDERTTEEYLRETLPHYLLGGNDDMVQQLTDAIVLMNHADTLGSIMKFDIAEQTRNAVMIRTQEYEEQLANDEIMPSAIQLLMPYMRIILALTEKYAALCMNPPYMGSGRFDTVLSKYVKDNYEEGKSDLMTVFMQVAMRLVVKNGYWSMINLPSWMFLPSFEEIRSLILSNLHIGSLIYCGRGIFGSDFGSVAFVIQNTRNSTPSTFRKLFDIQGSVRNVEEIRMNFLDASRKDYTIPQSEFLKIPSMPFAFWLPKSIINSFNSKVSDYGEAKKGLSTGDNNRFLRFWYEVALNDSIFDATNFNNEYKWYPINKGGGYRKWYGNNDYVINWLHNGEEIKSFSGSVIRNPSFYLQESLTWTMLSASCFGIRYSQNGKLFEGAGPSLFAEAPNIFYILGILCSKLGNIIIRALNPTINININDVLNLPVPKPKANTLCIQSVKSNVSLSKQDWDSHETSWDFEENPLVALANQQVKEEGKSVRMKDLVTEFEADWTDKFMLLHANEEQLNREFISIYGLEDELSPDVPLSEITILQQGEISIE